MNEKHNFKKPLGQNFLQNEDVADVLVESAEVDKKDKVLEIGPGQGVVTRKLIEKAGDVVSIELDPELYPFLKNEFKDKKNFNLVEGDALEFLRNEILQKESINKITASVPYQITSPLLHAIVSNKETLEICSLLIQKEVAEKLLETTPKSNYLAVFVSTFFEVSLKAYVKKTDFYPVPQVDGAIIKLKKLSNPIIKDNEVEAYSKLLHHGFLQKRKMINKRFSKEILDHANLSGTIRAETLEIKQWVELFKITQTHKLYN